MGEIKFRFWDGELLIYIDDWIEEIKNMKSRQFGSELIVNTLDLPSIQTILNNKNGVWMQDTGIKDANGKNIHDGDIVKVGIEPFIQIFEVKLDNIEIKTHNLGNITINTFVLYDRKTEYKEPLILERINGLNVRKIVYEIIGNIYENPELL